MYKKIIIMIMIDIIFNYIYTDYVHYYDYSLIFFKIEGYNLIWASIDHT